MDHNWPGLTDKQWDDIKSVLPWHYTKPPTRRRKRQGGMPRVPDKIVFDAVLWTLAGGTLDRLPRRFGSRKTTVRRLQRWYELGSVEHLWRAYMRTIAPGAVEEWERRFKSRKWMPFWQDALKMEFFVQLRGRPG